MTALPMGAGVAAAWVSWELGDGVCRCGFEAVAACVLRTEERIGDIIRSAGAANADAESPQRALQLQAVHLAVAVDVPLGK